MIMVLGRYLVVGYLGCVHCGLSGAGELGFVGRWAAVPRNPSQDVGHGFDKPAHPS